MNAFKIIVQIAALSAVLLSCASAESGDTKTENEMSVCGRIEIAVSAASGERKMSAVLYDNSSSRALLERLSGGKMTLAMDDYGGFEKVADLGFSLPRNDTPTDTDAGDLILYQGRNFVIYYDRNSWNFTPLGKIENILKAELKSILGSGRVRVTLGMK